jgi:hypothetical protein
MKSIFDESAPEATQCVAQFVGPTEFSQVSVGRRELVCGMHHWCVGFLFGNIWVTIELSRAVSTTNKKVVRVRASLEQPTEFKYTNAPMASGSICVTIQVLAIIFDAHCGAKYSIFSANCQHAVQKTLDSLAISNPLRTEGVQNMIQGAGTRICEKVVSFANPLRTEGVQTMIQGAGTRICEWDARGQDAVVHFGCRMYNMLFSKFGSVPDQDDEPMEPEAAAAEAEGLKRQRVEPEAAAEGPKRQRVEPAEVPAWRRIVEYSDSDE